MHFAPKSLFSRFLLIIVIPIIILQLITTYIFYQRHWESVSDRMKTSVIRDIQAIVTRYGETNLSKAQDLARIFNIRIKHYPNKKLSELIEYPLITDRDLKDFKTRFIEVYPTTEAFYLNDGSDIAVYTQLSHDVISFEFSNKKIQSPTTVIFILWVFGSALLLLIIAVIFMKNQVRAIMNLSTASERFGKGLESPRFKPSGATEVKRAGWAFIRMQRRIKRQIQHRTELLSHISHDLRTPLTRIKLSLEMMKEAKNDENLQSDIKEMEKLIAAYLDFAKEEGNEESKSVVLGEYLERILTPFNDKRLKIINHCPKLEIALKKEAFKRAISNLVTNGLKYCNKTVRVVIKKQEYSLVILIEDDGKGIPKRYWKDAFKPFFKIDETKEGHGLGLAIVRTIVYNHGGTIKLDKSSLGGLKVIIKLPI